MKLVMRKVGRKALMIKIEAQNLIGDWKEINPDRVFDRHGTTLTTYLKKDMKKAIDRGGWYRGFCPRRINKIRITGGPE